MNSIIEISVQPSEIENPERIDFLLSKKIPRGDKTSQYTLRKRSIDARKKQVVFRLQYIKAESIKIQNRFSDPLSVDKAKEVIIIGAGPAGYFAALRALSLGLKPIVLDRGKDVRQRRKDLRAIQQFGEVNPHSNYCFGEGGAGTYSDGKLYTRSHKRGNIQEILEILVEHGATRDILIDAHPHIGSNKLPGIIAAIRETILKFGGEVHFETFINDMDIVDGNLVAVHSEGEITFKARAFVLATGHSARDIFKLLHSKGVRIEAKDFALGVRIEHPQELIDGIQYKQRPRHENLPAASYSLATQVNGKGVFSFCNCPGGLIVPAATAPGEIVVNGMSLSKRDSPFSNSGIVTELKIEELNSKGYSGIFAGIEFQSEVETSLFKHGDGSQQAPGQKLTDFIHYRDSVKLNKSSYIPGVYAAPLHKILPEFIAERIRSGIVNFGAKLKGFISEEAQIVATESRTSSPIKIPRDPMSKMHVEVKGLFPCGEGAGYAGGILSAAMDGQNVMDSVGDYLLD